MNFNSFYEAGFVIQIHMVVALAAILIGAIIFINPKGTPRHKAFGKIWVGLMVVVALTSFFISEFKTLGPFSPIHLLSVVTLATLYHAIRAIRMRNVKAHKSALRGLYFGGLLVAGFFTLLPGRVLNKMLFGEPDFYLTTPSLAWVLPFSAIFIAFCIIGWRARGE